MRPRTGAGRHRVVGGGTTGRLGTEARSPQHPGMIERMGRRLTSALGRGASDPDPPDPTSIVAVPAGRDVDFVAYGDDCLLVGRLRLDGDRLTDLLNERSEYEIRDLVVERLSDGYAAQAEHLLVARDELLLVQANGPRGDLHRRLRTRGYPVAAQVGPYRVRGVLHAMPGMDPTLVIYRRAPMVPLTDAVIERPVGLEQELQSLGTVVVNRDRVEWVVPTWDDAPHWRELELQERPEEPAGGAPGATIDGPWPPLPEGP